MGENPMMAQHYTAADLSRIGVWSHRDNVADRLLVCDAKIDRERTA